jgi:Protein of unknown function (DUF4236)
MSWRWRKSFGRGPLRINLSKGGIGWSFGIPGLRIGRSPSGRPYVSQSIPGTGLSWIKYLGDGKQPTNVKLGAPGVGPAPQASGPAIGALPAPHLSPPKSAHTPAAPVPTPGRPSGVSTRFNSGRIAGAVTRFFDRLF